MYEPNDEVERSRLAPGRCLVGATLLLATIAVPAMDITPSDQKPGSHSTVATSDGSIRDDELIDHICDSIKAHGGQVKDVKLMVNSCYGGGLLDDMQRAFGPGGACAGIPWVAGTASSADESAWGWSDDVVDANTPNFQLGSHWTNALTQPAGANANNMPGVLRGGSASNNVLGDMQRARNRDFRGPNGTPQREHPQVASGNGGHDIMWTMANGKHEAVVFGGAQTDKRHINNVNNMERVLEETWPDGTYNIQKLGHTMPGATRQELLNAIDTAASRLDANTQLVVYIDDHGGSSFDLVEAGAAIADALIEEDTQLQVEIPRSWLTNWYGNYFASRSEYPSPGLWMDVTFCEYCDYWDYRLSGEPMVFPMGSSDPLKWIPFDFYRVRPGMNYVEIYPSLPPSSVAAGTPPGKPVPQAGEGGLRFSSMELFSGRANELQSDTTLQPGQSGAWYNGLRDGEGLYVELLDEHSAVVYMFTYDPDGNPAWMLGVAKLVGEGFVIEELLKPEGATFGDAYDPADVNYVDFGMLAMHLPDCGAQNPASLFILPPMELADWAVFNDFGYAQLTSMLNCSGGGGHVNHPWSGSWYDPAHNGEGIILQVLPDGTVVATWFTYDNNGEQMWVTGSGMLNGNSVEIDQMVVVQGPTWGPAYDPGARSVSNWGSVRISFDGCGAATLEYDSTLGFGSGRWDMQRLTALWGMACTE